MKQKIIRFLEWRTGRYLHKTRPIVVAVVGSIGKTSTTQAIATVLRQKYSVVTTKLNYNTDVGVIMSIFDLKTQTSPLKWLLLCIKVVVLSVGRPRADAFVLELGTDAPGQIAPFKYLHPFLAVVTGVQPEHMEYFKTMDSVAKEELHVSHFTKRTLINADLTEPSYITKYARGDTICYGEGYEYDANVVNGRVHIHTPGGQILDAHTVLIGRSGKATVLAAAAVGHQLGMSNEQIEAGIAAVEPAPGRMSTLEGLHGSTIIDDTYNASPEAYASALDYLYEQQAPVKIVLMGMMNELGSDTERFHREIGKQCKASELSLVVTLGKEANEYSGDEAEKAGCKVVRTSSPIEAAEVIKKELKKGTLVLAKGSQNGVYAEETVKCLLAYKADASKLVRQNDYWPAKKAKQFPELLS